MRKLAVVIGVTLAASAVAQDLPSDIPKTFKPADANFGYERRVVEIPMRDKVKLHTVLLIPKGAARRADPARPHALRRRQVDQRTIGRRTPRNRSPRGDADFVRDGLYPRVLRTCAASMAREGDRTSTNARCAGRSTRPRPITPPTPRTRSTGW